MAQEVVTLPAAVAQKYTLVNWVGGSKQHFGKYGTIDVTKLTMRRADKLFSMGWSKIALATPAETTTTSSKK